MTVYFCNSNKADLKITETKNAVAGYVNNSPVSLTDIDKAVQQELYDELYRIYIIRKTALNEYLKENMLQLEAQKHNQTKEQYSESYVQKNTNEKSLSAYIQKYNITVVPELKRTLKYYSNTCKNGK